MQAQETGKGEAQLDRTVVVENLYNPDIMNANKINLLPTLEEPQATKKQIEYAEGTNPSNRFDFEPMANFGNIPHQTDAPKGYLRAGYGTNGNVDGRLSYQFNWGMNDKLNADIIFRGMDGKIEMPEIPSSEYEWDARTYRTTGTLDWTHYFNTLTLRIDAQGENQVFNYNNPSYIEDNHQHNILGSLQANLENGRSQSSIRFKAGTGLLYAQQKYAFRYRNDSESYREYNIRSHALVSGEIHQNSHISIAAQMDNLFIRPGGDYKHASHTVLQLNPYLQAQGEQWSMRLGLHIDPLFGNGEASVSWAPDLYGEYALGKSYHIYLQTTGGRTVNDFRTINRHAPYAGFPIFAEGNEGIGFYTPKHSYTPIDGRLGFKATPMNELSLHIYGGYRIVDDYLFSTCQNSFADIHYCFLMQDKANTLYARITAQYSWKDILTTQASFEWNKWDADLLEQYTTLTPEMVFHWSANIHPIKELNIGASYQYEQRCKDYTGDRADAINNVGVTASYRISDKLTIYAQGDNLLNQKYNLDILHPAQGINFLGGAVLEF